MKSWVGGGEAFGELLVVVAAGGAEVDAGGGFAGGVAGEVVGNHGMAAVDVDAVDGGMDEGALVVEVWSEDGR